MAVDRPTTTTDGERPPPDADCVTDNAGVTDSAGVAPGKSSSTGVAFVDIPTSVLKISDPDDAGDDDDDEKEEESAAENDDLPYPEYVEKAFFYFLQTTRPRNWCLQLIAWPYPLCTYYPSALRTLE